MRAAKKVDIEAMRQRVFFEQSGFCFICIEPMVLTKDRGNPHRCELAHRIAQSKPNLRLWGERVIHHRLNLRGTHPHCNSAVSLNPDSLEAERLVYDIQKSLKSENDRRYQGRAMGRMK